MYVEAENWDGMDTTTASWELVWDNLLGTWVFRYKSEYKIDYPPEPKQCPHCGEVIEE